MVDDIYPEQFKLTINNPLISMNDAEFKPFTKIQVFDLYNTYRSLAVLTVFNLLNDGMSSLDITAQAKVGVDHIHLKKGLIEERAVNIPLLEEVFMLVSGSDDLSNAISWPQYITVMAIMLPHDLKDRFKNLLAIIDPASKQTFTLHQVHTICLLCSEQIKFASSPEHTLRVEKATDAKAQNIFKSFSHRNIL